jgi:PKHD-type hydroxylase
VILQIANVLTEAELGALRELMGRPELFTDGRRTAGWRARERKHNLQTTGDDAPLVTGAQRKIEDALLGNEVFQAAAQPKAILGQLLSRYEPGMVYGAHVDDAMIGGRRADLSFTLFLSERDSYAGGELVIEATEGDRGFKLQAGHLLLYPATSLHRVEPVTRGVRLAAVGWVRSFVRDDGKRELLFDLEEVVEILRRSGGPERALDLVLKARSNLLRRWIDD